MTTETSSALGAQGIAVGTAPSRSPPSESFLDRIPRDFAREHLIISTGRAGHIERLHVAPGANPAAIFNVGVRLGVRVSTSTGDPEAIARRIDEVYATRRPDPRPTVGIEVASVAGQIDHLLAEADRDLLSTQGKGPIVRLVDAILFEALGRNASDVHVQPLADRTLIRYRIDGVLQTVREASRALTQPLVSRIKVMGRMDIAERRVPQDGRATVTIGSGGSARSIDLRISTLPTSYGERAVVRLLESGGSHPDRFEPLGMPAHVIGPYLERVSRSSGIVLVTGPTGSGKTTTLYTTLRHIASHAGVGLNVMTIEDPIEYELSTSGVAISQAQVNTKKGITFASGLRHILRQDPDVVMVGEIRDEETARIAIQASLTGHLVFSTLHTSDAAGAVTRLVDLGVEPYLVSASLSAVLAQRLVRRRHGPCEGAGCGACFQTGYLGRIGLFELLVVTDEVRSLISRGADASEVRKVAVRDGMRTLVQEGERLAAQGVTTALEVSRVVQA